MTGPSAHLKSISIMSQTLITLCLTVTLYFTPSGADPEIMWFVVILFYTYCIFIFVPSVQIVPSIKSYASVDSMFMLFFFLLFIWPYHSHLLGISDFRVNKYINQTFENGANQALIATAIAFSAFILGLSLARKSTLGSKEAWRQFREGAQYRYYGYFILMILVGLITIYISFGLRGADEGRYTRSESGGVLADGIYNLIITFCIVAIGRSIATLRQGKLDPAMYIALPIVLFWSLRILLAGDRNSFFLMAVAAVAGVSAYIVTLSRVILVVGIFVAMTVYRVVEVLRNSDALSLEVLIEALLGAEEAPDAGGISGGSFGISTATVRAAFYIIPNSVDYAYGWFKLIGFGGIIPFIRGYLLQGEQWFTNTAEVYTYYMVGPAATWSVGTNIITDIYADFGIIGIPIVMMLFGAVAGYFENFARRSLGSTKSVVFYILMVALFSQAPRYSVDAPVRAMFWAFMSFVIYEVIMRAISARRIPRVPHHDSPKFG